MNVDPFPHEYELLSLFESEPTLLDPKVPWAYNTLHFETTRGVDHVICEIEPGYEVVRISWNRDGNEVVHLNLNWVLGLSVEVEDGREALISHFRDPALEPLRLQLRPFVHLGWAPRCDFRKQNSFDKAVAHRPNEPLAVGCRQCPSCARTES